MYIVNIVLNIVVYLPSRRVVISKSRFEMYFIWIKWSFCYNIYCATLGLNGWQPSDANECKQFNCPTGPKCKQFVAVYGNCLFFIQLKGKRPINTWCQFLKFPILTHTYTVYINLNNELINLISATLSPLPHRTPSAWRPTERGKFGQKFPSFNPVAP